jgi:molecular chaperone GrpE
MSDDRDDRVRPFQVRDRRFWAGEESAAAGSGGAPSSNEGTGNGNGSGSGEAAEDETPSPQYPTYIEQLRAELAEKDRQLKEYIAAYQDQVVRGLEETKQRLRRENERELERLRGRVVEDLLDVLDNLDRSVAAAEQVRPGDPLVEGVRLVRNQFAAKLAALGLSQLEALGQPFDPSQHEAIALLPVDDPERDGRVVAVVRNGYRFGDRVLRPASVQVGKLAS